MMTVDEARTSILSCCAPLHHEKAPLLEAVGRVLAVDVKASFPLPAFSHSSVDGYAIRSGDLVLATVHAPVMLVCVGEASAGHPYHGALLSGQTVHVTTGAQLPPGADAVEKEEQCEAMDNSKVSFAAPVSGGSFVREQGSEVPQGAIVCTAGSHITPERTAILASLGYRTVRVYRRPSVNILPTGDELVDLDTKPGTGQLYANSSYLLASLLSADGAIPCIHDIVPDAEKRLRKGIRAALRCDILITTGGTSKGRHDHLRKAANHIGVPIHVPGVRMRPGRPMVFGTYKKTLMFGLPGNPLATYVTYHQFVRPAIRRLCGMARPVGDRVEAVMEEPYDKQDERHHFVLGIIAARGGSLFVRSAGLQHSGAMAAIPRANCLISIPENVVAVREGDLVSVEMIPGQNLFTEQIQ